MASFPCFAVKNFNNQIKSNQIKLYLYSTFKTIEIDQSAVQVGAAEKIQVNMEAIKHKDKTLKQAQRKTRKAKQWDGTGVLDIMY